MHIGHEHIGVGQPASTDDTAVCPVMNIKVSKRTAAEHGLIRIRNGETHYLCCEECAVSFSDSEMPEQTAGGGK